MLENNEDIHSHPCGEYVLEQLQHGVSAEAVAEKLLSEYLVRTTKQRVLAYRHYREQRGAYWTAQHLQNEHWEWLYQQVSLDSSLVRIGGQRGGQHLKETSCMITVRTSLCAHVGIAEELVPFHNIRLFFCGHEKHAQLALLYPRAKVVKDTVSWAMVDAYRKTFSGQPLMKTAWDMVRSGTYPRCVQVAEDSKYIAFPKSCADACLVAGYVMLKCEEVFAGISWQSSLLTPIQRTFAAKYPKIDFHFWVMYGSWSWCSDCGSFFFNDKYFSEAVYRNVVTSETPDLLSGSRRHVPSSPREHAHGDVGVSSRWWYLPGMYKPVHYCERCTRPPADQTAAQAFTEVLRQKHADHLAGRSYEQGSMHVTKTGQLYRTRCHTGSLQVYLFYFGFL
jgi:hypothetical protein